MFFIEHEIPVGFGLKGQNLLNTWYVNLWQVLLGGDRLCQCSGIGFFKGKNFNDIFAS